MGLNAVLEPSKSWGSCLSSSSCLPHAHCARQLRMCACTWTLPAGLQAARRRQRMRAQSAGALSDNSAGGHASTSSEPAGTSTGAGTAGRDGKAKAGAWLRQRFFSRLQASSGHESDDSDATSRASSSNDLQVKGLDLPARVEVAVGRRSLGIGTAWPCCLCSISGGSAGLAAWPTKATVQGPLHSMIMSDEQHSTCSSRTGRKTSPQDEFKGPLADCAVFCSMSGRKTIWQTS